MKEVEVFSNLRDSVISMKTVCTGLFLRLRIRDIVLSKVSFKIQAFGDTRPRRR